MAESIRVSLILDDTEYTGKISTAAKNAEDLGKKVQRAGDEGAGGLGKLTNGAELLRGKMAALSAVLLGAGFAEMTHKALALSDDISDLSKGTDVSIARILQLRDAFAANGGSAEGLGKLLNKMNITLYDAQEGSAQAQEALLKLGFTFKDMANLNTDQAFQKVINKLAGMRDPVERNALAFRTLGKEAKNIDWDGIAAGTRSVDDEFLKYSASLAKAGEAHDKLQQAAEKLTIAFVGLLEGVGILDFINSMSNDMAKFEKIIVGAGLALTLYFGASTVIMLVELGGAMMKVVQAVEALGVAMGVLTAVSAPITRLLTVIGFLAGAAVAAYYGIDDVMDAVDRNNKARTDRAIEEQAKLEEARKKAASSGALPAVTPAWAKEVAALDQISESYANQNKELLDKLRFEGESLGLSSEELKQKQMLLDLTKAYNKQIEDINNKLKQEQASPQSAARDARIAQLKTERMQVEENYNVTKDLATKQGEENIQNARRFETGWDNAFKNYKNSAFNAADEARRVFDKFTQGMEDTLVTFFKTGKLGWKDFIASMVEELLRSQLKQTISMMMPTFGGQGGGGQQGGGNVFGALGSLLGFAGGGTIPTNSPVLVGENGPELLVGAQGMNVIPNGQMGGNTTVHYNINAVDAMSFKAMIARDPSFIHAVAMQGAKTMPGRA